MVTLVANQAMRTPRSEFINSVLVPTGMNVADRRIVELVEPGDLVITADIPLAAEVVAKGGQALDPRGELYTEANIGERLAVRNLFDELRGGGQITGGPVELHCQGPAGVREPTRSLADGGEGLNSLLMQVNAMTTRTRWIGLAVFDRHLPRRGRPGSHGNDA